MSVTEKYLTYRGEVRALVGVGKALLFVTEHADGLPMALYRLDCESYDLDAAPLPAGGRSLCVAGDEAWVGGTDGSVLRAPTGGGKAERSLTIEPGPAVAVAPLADGRLAVATGSKVTIADVGKKTGKPLQTLDLPSDATRLASDPTGRWLVAGTSRGDVAVFTAEGREDFVLSESSRLHEGAVTALLFEPDELRFLSSGADRKLLSTLARGTLEPEDKGKSYIHVDPVTSIAWAPGDRFLTGAGDSTVKTWPRAGGARPATLSDGVAKVRALAIVHVHERPRLVVLCEDNTLRFFALDAAGKFGDATAKLHDAMARARHELAEADPRRREAAVAELAAYGDAASLELLAQHSRGDGDPTIRLDAARRLAASEHPRSVPLLEGLLGHQDEAVRLLAFDALHERLGAEDLRPIDLALKTEKPDVGRRAVEALTPLARRDDQAFDRLQRALDAREWEVRRAAASAIESIAPADSPDPNLAALDSKHADLRRWALLRLHHRELLDAPGVATALRRRAEDTDGEVRGVAFLLSLLTRPALAAALAARDADLVRQQADLASDVDEAGKGNASAKKAKASRSKSSKTVNASADLGPDDLAPLVNAAASRSLDTALRGARGLALLGDPRAFGLLLQLSREDDASARVAVCRALAELGDAGAVDRLRSLLHDPAAEVRDAAFTGLAALLKSEPLRAAEAGLVADQEDVRRRGLQLLLAEVRKAPPKAPDAPLGLLMLRALNDGAAGIRSEAFKAAMNLPLFGGGAELLRFARRSVHADVRREVLTELMARPSEPWFWELLFACFDDPDPVLRADAFAFATKKSRGLEPLEAAIGSRYADLRLEAVEALTKKKTAAAQAILARGLDDDDRKVRLATLQSLIAADARPSLERALAGPHVDVRVRAGLALAKLGDRAGLGPLVALAAAPEPREAERVKDWNDLASSALDALAELGDPEAIPAVLPLLDSPHEAIRKGAGRVLAWCASADHEPSLREALAHADPEVKYRAAMGLAILGDAAVAPLVDSAEGSKVLGAGDRLAVAAAMGDAGEARIVVALDDKRDAVRDRAFAVLLARELTLGPGAGGESRLLAALSSRSARVRLVAADALRAAHDRDALRSAAASLLNDRGEKPAWSIGVEAVDTLAALLALATAAVRARAASRLLRQLDPDVEKQEGFDQALAAHAERFAAELAASPTPTPARPPADRLLAHAFGAYVGLAREQGSRPSGGKKGGRTAPTADAAPAVAARVRRSAIDRLRAMVDADPARLAEAVPVFIRALSDPNQEARLAAFEHLKALGTDPATLGAEALAAGQADVGVKGLEALGGAAGDDEAGRAVLEQVMTSRKDDLAIEAARLLRERPGAAPGSVAAKALEAAHEPLRLRAIAWLGEHDDKASRTALRGALESRYAAVRRAAAVTLASKKDPAAFDALMPMLASGVAAEQNRAIASLQELGDPRAAGAFLDRVESDLAGTAQADALLAAAGRFRRPEDAGRLLSLMEREPKRRNAAFQALLAISGYDQILRALSFEALVDDGPDVAALDEIHEAELKHPRRDDVIARLLDRCLADKEARLLLTALPAARWSPGHEVDEPLTRLAASPDDSVRRPALLAIAWRFRHRGASAEPLLKALNHADPETQFLGAEGLALAGRGEGANVLLAAIDFLDDLALRLRAVTALGRLGDARSLDRILKLAAEAGHALQAVAAEAIGRLGRSEKKAEVLALLLRHSRSEDQGLATRALAGLRWLGTAEAWARVREVADLRTEPGLFATVYHGPFALALVAVDLLAHDDEPATRDVLLRQVRAGSQALGFAALRSARALMGPDAIEPDEAALRGPLAPSLIDPTGWEQIQRSYRITLEAPLERLRDRAGPDRLFALLADCHPEVAGSIEALLIDRPDPPLAEARAALGSTGSASVRAAARVVGRARDKKAGPAIASALAGWLDRWDAAREADRRRDEYDDDPPATEAPTRCLTALAWAAGRCGGAIEVMADLVTSRTDAEAFEPIRRAAAEAIVLLDDPPESAVAALDRLAREGGPALRHLAADALACCDAKRAAAVAPDLLTDPVGFDRLTAHAGDALAGVLRGAAGTLHAQGVAVPHLVDRGDVGALAEVAADRSLSDPARLGAIEGLSAMATEEAEEHLRRAGLDEQNDEDLRKAAWRALRRSKRARDRREAAAGSR